MQPQGHSVKLSIHDNLNIIRYDDASPLHLTLMEILLNSRGMDLGLLNDLPKMGYLAVDGHAIIAAGFLRHSESKAVMLDSLVTNAHVAPEIRDYVLNILVKNIIKLAQVNGYTHIVAFTSDKNTLERAMSHGFELLPYTVISLRLPGE